MRKNWLFTIIAVACVGMLIGCGAKEPVAEQDVVTVEEQPSEEESASVEVVTQEEQKELTENDVYLKFINRECKAKLTYPVYPFEEGKEYYLSDIINATVLQQHMDWNYSELKKVEYGYADFGQDGTKDLIVRVVISLHEEGYMDMTKEYAFSFVDNELHFVYGAESMYRYSEAIYKTGLIRSGGSYSAFEYVISESVLDEKGEYHPIYDMMGVNGMGEAIIPKYDMPDYDALPEEYNYDGYDYIEEADEISLEMYNFDNGEIWCVFMDNLGVEVAPNPDYMSYYEERNIRFLSYEEIRERVSAEKAKYNLDGEEAEEDIEYIELDLNAYLAPAGANWMEGYQNFLTNRIHLVDILGFEDCMLEECEPIMINGFTLVELTGDSIPELLLCVQEPGIYTGEHVYIYSYNPKTHLVQLKNSIYSYGGALFDESIAENDGYIDPIWIDTVAQYSKDHVLLPGLTSDGKLIGFYNYGYHDINFELYEYLPEEETEFCNIVYTQYSDFGEDGEVSGNLDDAKQILSDFKPLRFYDIDNGNLAKYLVEDYKSTDIYDYTAQDVVSDIQDKQEWYWSMDKDGLESYYICGENFDVHYDLDLLMQWRVYNEW